MDAVTLVKAALPWVVAAIVLGGGLNLTFADVREALRRPGRLVRVLVAMYVASPALAVALALLLPLPDAVALTLVVLAACPGAPLVGWKLTRRGADAAAVYGLVAIASAASVVTVPVAVVAVEAITGVATALEVSLVVGVVARSFLLPLAVGMGIRWAAPALPARVGHWIQALSLGLVLVVALLIVGKSFGAILALGAASLAALAAFAVGLLGIGFALGGPTELGRRSLATACAMRHPGVAIPVSASLASVQTLPVVLAYLLLFAVSEAVLARLRGPGITPSDDASAGHGSA